LELGAHGEGRQGARQGEAAVGQEAGEGGEANHDDVCVFLH